ncbi:MAG: SIR2 family protein [Methylocystis sp.]|uniref:SIR2 family protein n=1 Tax=Methylocystis sp. TaxID=1911079 RepID=UPI003DA35BDD
MSADKMKLDHYRVEVAEDIATCLQEKCCQPILFIGSGLSRRHFSGPSWDELLSHLAANCPLIEKEYAYYKQLHGNPLKIGSEFAKLYREWAWSAGHNKFPKELFKEEIPADAYIKFAIAEHLKSLTPKTAESDNPELAKEIAAIKSIRPHAIITTNYDQFIEEIFPEFTPIIGQQIIQGANLSVGEIFKIHGCVSDFQSLIFTEDDYASFTKRKKYLSGKLLTFFCEHPLLFLGYSANDPNIRAILSDIDEALPVTGGIIPNVYILEWRKSPPTNPAREKLIEIEGGKSVRIKAIETDEFVWVFEAFGAHQSLNAVSPRILRALLSRSYDLVRHDIPRRVIEADFSMLEHAVENNEGFAKLFGLTTISEPSQVAANYPYSLTQLGKKLGYASWHKAHKAIDIIENASGVNIKESDNQYHCGIKLGESGPFHKYSEEAFALFKKVLANEPYEVNLKKKKEPPKAPPSTQPRAAA